VLAVNNEPCTADGEGGFDLWDVSDPRQPKALVRGAGDRTEGGSLEQVPGERANSSHSVFLWQDGGKAYAVAVDNTELTDVDIFDITDPRNPCRWATTTCRSCSRRSSGAARTATGSSCTT
jgi:hypothetical protein